jgi:hypothetical protein
MKIYFVGDAVTQEVIHRLPTAAAPCSSLVKVTGHVWWTTGHWGGGSFSPSTSVSPANSTLIIIHFPELVQ